MLGQRSRGRAALFGVLLGLFAARVAAQIWQAVRPTPLLPPFDAWQSGTLPYSVLLASQVAILAGGLWLVARLASGSFEPRRGLGRVLLWVGGVYLAAASFRLIAGVTFLHDVHFFSLILPATFHVVLALMVLVVADFHVRSGAPRDEAS